MELTKIDTKPVLGFLSICVCFVAFAVWSSHSKKLMDQDYEQLAKSARLVNGFIVKFEPYPGMRIFDQSGGSIEDKPGIHVSIAVDLGSGDKNLIHEDWPAKLKENFVVGDTIEVLYLESNELVKFSSKSNKNILYFIEQYENTN